ncbi:O-antigen ligase family protein [Kineobactrum salinum]|uniref:O-antigen ligase family protein n=1 Tax=Kineobactrum salinum TaxID=2708301 RepID=A0A6C0U2D2_9GAMM|nr:O-antigen ligase family protein [Kineobactrum salinum]QIB65973.1 O-antigen ligase family protein [Kineobactrum salinum]
MAFFLVYMTGTLVSIMLSGSYRGLLSLGQTIMYPLCFGFLIASGYKYLWCSRRSILVLLVFLAFGNATVALLGAIGAISSVPFFGEVGQGRYIFGTTMHSSNGLAFNVNYYATIQGAMFFLYAIMAGAGGRRIAGINAFVLVMIFASSLIGSSRGGLVSFCAAFLSVGLIARPSIFTIKGSALLLGSIAAGVAILANLGAIGAYLYEALRLWKGLAMRGDLWSAAWELWMMRPVFGWGDLGGEGLATITYGEYEGSSMHSGYLNTLVRGGMVQFFASFGFVVFALLWGLGRSRVRWYINRWAVGGIVFYLVNAIFRTYSIGGLGLLPVIVLIASSICLYSSRTDKVYSSVPAKNLGGRS